MYTQFLFITNLNKGFFIILLTNFIALCYLSITQLLTEQPILHGCEH